MRKVKDRNLSEIYAKKPTFWHYKHREEVCGAAGINLRNYERLVSGQRGARKATLAKIKAALRALERQKGRAP